jgi:hypothetical protein
MSNLENGHASRRHETVNRALIDGFNAFRPEWDARVARQGGVKTFFDNWVATVYERFERGDDLRPPDRYRASRIVTRRAHGRFVHPVIRLKGTLRSPSELGLWPLVTSQGTMRSMEWHGLPLIKSIYDLAIYMALLQELRPQTIVEIGSGSGGSALWFADMLETLDITPHIHSVDLQAPTLERAGVHFYSGDCHAIESVLAIEEMRTWPSPWLVVEDAHVNVGGVLRHLDQAIWPGSYIVVEDSRGKRRTLRSFIADCDRYSLDTDYTDFFGRNATSAADSIFRCER